MEIPGQKIVRSIEIELKKRVKKLNKKIKLSIFLVGAAPDQLSYVNAKRKTAARLGVKFDLHHIKKIPTFESFINLLKDTSADPTVTGIIIQQPLPSQLDTESIYDFIDIKKEIEGHRKKTTFIPPIGLTVMTVLKYIYADGNDNLLVDFNREKALFKRITRNLKVVLIGRGITGGRPIGKTLTAAGINYININSSTPNPNDYYKDADIIVTAVGKKVIHPEMLKEGVVLINVGLRREGGKLKGDYDEREIKNIASHYTPTPGGTGPIDVLYLFENLIEAAKLQK